MLRATPGRYSQNRGETRSRGDSDDTFIRGASAAAPLQRAACRRVSPQTRAVPRRPRRGPNFVDPLQVKPEAGPSFDEVISLSRDPLGERAGE